MTTCCCIGFQLSWSSCSYEGWCQDMNKSLSTSITAPVSLKCSSKTISRADLISTVLWGVVITVSSLAMTWEQGVRVPQTIELLQYCKFITWVTHDPKVIFSCHKDISTADDSTVSTQAVSVPEHKHLDISKRHKFMVKIMIKPLREIQRPSWSFPLVLHLMACTKLKMACNDDSNSVHIPKIWGLIYDKCTFYFHFTFYRRIYQKQLIERLKKTIDSLSNKLTFTSQVLLMNIGFKLFLEW